MNVQCGLMGTQPSSTRNGRDSRAVNITGLGTKGDNNNILVSANQVPSDLKSETQEVGSRGEPLAAGNSTALGFNKSVLHAATNSNNDMFQDSIMHETYETGRD